MTERHAILTAIRENPDDDTPRLVYADWLEEHGEPERADLIRLQMELWRLGMAATWLCQCDSEVGFVCDWCHDREPLMKRLRSVSSSVTFPIAVSDPLGGTIKGIVQLFECTWECWREHGDAIWERELPWKVRLTTMPELTAGGDIEFVGHTARTFRYRIAGRIAAVSRKSKARDPWVANILRARWPGIDFELPPVGSRGRWRNFAMRYEDLPRG